MFLFCNTKKEKKQIKETKKPTELKKQNSVLWIILLIVGLLPWLLLLVVSISSIFEGFSFIDQHSIYGIDAFKSSFVLLGYVFSPVLIIGAALVLLSLVRLDKIKTNNKLMHH